MSQSIVVVERVSKTYQGSVTALDDVSLQIPHGQFCVLLGRSGAGKSTLLKLFTGLQRPTTGTAFFDGIEVLPRTVQRIRPRIGAIHQQFHLVPRLTVLDNVLAGALPRVSLGRAVLRWFPRNLQRRACALLADVGLTEEHLYRRAQSLSGGQQQRVAVARAFMLEPRLVLADEPVASLDPETGASILSLLRECSQKTGTTVFCSLHQVELAKQFADRIIGLTDGRVTFDDEPGELTDEAVSNIYSTP